MFTSDKEILKARRLISPSRALSLSGTISLSALLAASVSEEAAAESMPESVAPSDV